MILFKMNWARNLAITLSFLIGGLLSVSYLNRCERFEPADELYFYADTITLVSRGNYTFHGAVVNLGEVEIQQHGFCWSDSNNPTIEKDSVISLGPLEVTGKFTGNVSGLNTNTTYYVEAYLVTASGTEYSEELSFKTPKPTTPEVSTSAITGVTETSAQCGGEVTDDGGGTVIARGVCWSRSPNPEVTDSCTIDGSGLGSFQSVITGLSSNTTYYVRAYASNSAGPAYGDSLKFTTSPPSIVEPTVNTSAISEVTMNSAECGGEVTDDGGGTVTARGVCWSRSSEPDVTDSCTIDGSGLESYSSVITGLSSNTTYYVRAYATNSAGPGYGDPIQFTTSQKSVVEPTVATVVITDVTETAVLFWGDVTDDGGGNVTERGVCWSTSPMPEIHDKSKAGGEGTGVFNVELTGLSCNTIYYMRAYAINSAGPSYGDPIEVKTDKCTSVIDIDGNRYDLVKIGDQTWMAENLKVTHYPDGSIIEEVKDSAQWSEQGTTNGAYCWFENNQSNGDVYGALYNWTAAMFGEASSYFVPSGVQGVCPDGWHLPSDNEWKQLEISLGMSQAEVDGIYWRGTNQGNQLKESGNLHWKSPSAGTNTTNFTALPGGVRRYQGYFEGITKNTYFWTSSETTAINAWDRYLYYPNEDLHRKDNNKGHGTSVRCIMNE